MKHLKRFNESISGLDKEEVQEFCENYLAYLLDDDYYLLIVEGPVYFKINFSSNKNYPFTLANEWDIIKDNFIPFLSMLDRSYNISKGKMYDEKVIEIDNQEYILSDVIQDNIYQPSKLKFKNINIYIKK